ncbi:hypothetical protein DPMN_000741 [Dreissena polymorpha]|uniref:Uncharacterized protein n=1 Tax=Dreissena polymorpha TaxID=45954 RepID=A0A9D4MGF5_DREPO|nr:hypothetical protein DPMN_000741 [Dreissena polymorpha]
MAKKNGHVQKYRFRHQDQARHDSSSTAMMHGERLRQSSPMEAKHTIVYHHEHLSIKSPSNMKLKYVRTLFSPSKKETQDYTTK